jgi:hypothetical protein
MERRVPAAPAALPVLLGGSAGLDEPGTAAATREASQRWPEPPPPPAGCATAESTWLHMSLCALEFASLTELIGRDAAAAELAQHRVYAWVYEQVLAEPAWFASYLARHGLRVPGHAPVPRRYFGPDWWRQPAEGTPG